MLRGQDDAAIVPTLDRLLRCGATLGAIAGTFDRLELVLAELDRYCLPLAAVVRFARGDAAALDRLADADTVGQLVPAAFRSQLVLSMGR